MFIKCSSTDLLKSKHNRDFFLRTGSNQVIRKQLTSWQKLVVTALIDQNVQVRTGVWGSQHCRIIRLNKIDYWMTIQYMYRTGQKLDNLIYLKIEHKLHYLIKPKWAPIFIITCWTKQCTATELGKFCYILLDI